MKLGRYRLLRELARGGMGIVWLAEARGPSGFSKTCVVKELLPALARDPRHRAMFLDEARLAAQLSHKNIVMTNDLGEDGNRLYMVLELLEGITLKRLMTLLGPSRLPPALAVRIIVEVLGGLDYAHRLKDPEGRPLGIVHRDVSPANVFLGFDGEVKLLDFGVARSRAHRDKTREGFIKGTAAYMSPDHVSRQPIDVRADVFTTGILLRELLLGERLWGSSTERSIVCHLIAGEIPPFESKPDVPESLRVMCERAMATAREDRFASAANMKLSLEAWLEANDPSGSLFDLRTYFETELEEEIRRVRDLQRVPSLDEEATQVAPPLPVELSSDLLVTDPGMSTPPKARKRERLMIALATVATIAALVSAAAAVFDDDPPPAAAAVESGAP